MDKCLLIFTRNPELGKVKTRLATDIGDKKALEIYKDLLDHTSKVSSKVNAKRYVWYTNEIGVNDNWDASLFEKKLQPEGDLGDKMKFAFESTFSEGYKKVVIIGSDLFDLKTELIEEAFEKLSHYDCVIGPANDGGYYLLGLKQMKTNLFENKPWGTEHVLNLTLKDIKLTSSYYLLETKNDIDNLDDLHLYPELIKKYSI